MNDLAYQFVLDLCHSHNFVLDKYIVNVLHTSGPGEKNLDWKAHELALNIAFYTALYWFFAFTTVPN
jgi:hypothetical protein